jgi:Tfp pilus assembly protein PilO
VRGRRGIVVAAAAAAILALLLILFLVLPKMSEVSTARQDLEEARAEQQTLSVRLGALQQARDRAPENQATIARVDQQVPPTADLPGVILLLRNAATSAGVSVLTLTPGAPEVAEQGNFSTIPFSATGSGSYFSIVDFLYSIETLPRAATVRQLDLAPGEAGSLTFTATIRLYTSDVSAGPRSEPGPTDEVAVPEA